MNLFKTFTLTWWQAGIFKVGLLALGIAVGARCTPSSPVFSRR